MEERFYLYQRAKTADGMLYDMEQYMPYNAEMTKEGAQSLFASLAPENIAYGSTATLHSEDENGARFEWKFEYEKNENDEGVFMLVSETYIDRVPVAEGGGDYPVITFGDGQDLSCSWSYEKVLSRTSEENNLACIIENEVEGHVLSAGGKWFIEATHLICAVVFGLTAQYVEYLPNGTLEPYSPPSDDIEHQI